ncbi:uncharacterized protein K02A2.6-like [Strongylocentrotus purpuratus]|uniref:Endonuclease n=1 Tax=Strongylocentrotus purpuratus TaxID=7668 RepID=A0A7M7PE48_STRPU|nr:uncharacterized protein K02A2.6-like [Strongylocentrotus purpuratus]
MAFGGADIKGLSQFDPTGDASVVSERWQRWYEEFDAYADSLGVFVDGAEPAQLTRRRALMMYSAGAAVREVFKTLEDTGTKADYDKAVNALEKHFVVQSNSTFQRHVFRQITQQADETVSQMVTRLKKAAEGCAFRDDLENQIRDQVVQGLRSSRLRRKLLEKGTALTLTATLAIAASLEAVEAMDSQFRILSSVDEFPNPSSQIRQVSNETRECFNCGRTGHSYKDSTCPAKGRICHTCGKKGHFATKCRDGSGKKEQTSGPNVKPRGKWGQKRQGHKVRQVDECTCHCQNKQGDEQNHSDDSERGYAFAIDTDKCEKVPVVIGGVPVDIIVDSGTTANIIDRALWEFLKTEKITCSSRRCNKKIYPYTSVEPLQTIGCFKAVVTAGERSVEAEFVVIAEKGEPLMSRKTALALGVLRIGIDVNSVKSYVDMREEFKPVFQGVGKLRDRQIKLKVDPEIRPVAQPVRRTPFGLRDRVKEKIQELVEQDIIEPVEEPTPWVSPVVIVPKPNGDIRICIDMRRVNEAIVRERHPIPTVDEILQELSTSKVFSKIDLKWGYHQLELDPESRKLTTFVTHCGLYRYKRLLFGVNAAPEIYQHEIHKVLQGLPGVANISDDIIIHGATQEEHDERLRQTLTRLKDAGLTANAEKCLFGVSELVFRGHKLTKDGINPTKAKIEAVANACEPIRSTLLPAGPWEDVAVDFLGPLPSGESILVIIDYYSRYYEYIVMRSTTAEKTVAALAGIFARHGLPLTLYSDNGPQFISQVFADYMRLTGVHHHRVTPKWPQANGEVERQNQSLEKRMRIAHSEGKDWKEALLSYVAAYRATPHSTTGKSPAELLFGRKIRTKLPVISESLNDQEIRDQDAESKGASKLYADSKRGAKPSDVVPGDEVLVRREVSSKMDTPFLPQPYTVVSREGNKLNICSPEGVMYARNTSHVKKYHRQGILQPEAETTEAQVPLYHGVGAELITPQSDVETTSDIGILQPEAETTEAQVPLYHGVGAELITPQSDVETTSDQSQHEGTERQMGVPKTVPSPTQTSIWSRPKRHRLRPKRFSDYLLE